MKQLIYTLLFLLSSKIAFSQNQDTEKSKVFQLSIENKAKVDVTRSKEWIKTNNVFTKNKSELQIEYHFDDKQLFYIRLIKSDLGIDKTYEVKRNKINGYGYISKKTDYKLDFFFPREKQGNETEILDHFFENPDFSDNEQLIIYAEEVYRNIANYFAENTGKIAFYGNVIAEKKFDFLYYRFDHEDFSPNQKIKIEQNHIDNYTKKYNGSYRIDFDRTQVKNYKTIYFSGMNEDSKDTILMKQNSINLFELKKQMTNTVTETETVINNDIFLDQYFKQLVSPKNAISNEEKNYIGTYTTKSFEDIEIVFELREGNIYYSKSGDIVKIGSWKLGKLNFIKKEGINIYNVHTINRKINNKRRPADIGDSWDIMISGEKLYYPISLPEIWNEIKKL